MATEIRYLAEEEKKRSLKLWQEAFPEDSREFADYYFQEKVRDNQILVKEEKGEILSMIHLNPYNVRVKNRIYPLDYIVGVATKKDRRYEGHMRSLLERMMEDMYRKEVPFTFLMPASEKIYYPFDFRFIFSQPVFTLLQDGYREVTADAGKMEADEARAGETAQWMEEWLKARYQVYAVRTADYVKRLDKELASEKGQWSFLYKEKGLAGIRCEWGLKEREQRLLYCNDSCEQDGKPAIMGRIICLREFIKNICLNKQYPENSLEAAIRVKDDFIRENSGLWKWRLGKDGSSLEKLEEEKFSGPVCELTIGEMMEWLSGFRPLEKEKWMAWAEPLNHIFLDEVV